MSANTVGSKQVYNSEIYIRRKEDCVEIDTGKGEKIYEFLGVNNGHVTQHSIALVEIIKGGVTQPHFHPEAEESYIIIEGEGRLIVNGETKIVKKDDVAKIPVGKTHQIFNDNIQTLKFYCVCAPAWTPKCSVYV